MTIHQAIDHVNTKYIELDDKLLLTGMSIKGLWGAEVNLTLSFCNIHRKKRVLNYRFSKKDMRGNSTKYIENTIKNVFQINGIYLTCDIAEKVDKIKRSLQLDHLIIK